MRALRSIFAWPAPASAAGEAEGTDGDEGDSCLGTADDRRLGNWCGVQDEVTLNV